MTGSNRRHPRCKRGDTPSESVDRQGLTSTPFAACTNACTKFREAETIQDTARQDAYSILQSLLKATDGDGDNGVKRQSDNPVERKAEGTGGVSMLEAVRMLAAMDSDERAVLVALIKALG